MAQRTLVRRHTFQKTWVGFVAFRPDGKHLAIAARAKTDDDRRSLELDWLDQPQPRVYLFDLTSQAEPEEVVCPHGPQGPVAYSADGKTLAVGGGGATHLFDVGRARP